MKMNPQHERAKARLESSGTGSGARRRFAFLGTDVVTDRKGNGIPVRVFREQPEVNRVLPATGNREAARRLRQQEKRNARQQA